VYRFVSHVDDLCTWLMARRPGGFKKVQLCRLSFQADQIRGVDVASVHLLTQLDVLGDPEQMCVFACEMGCAERTKSLALALRTQYADCPRRRFLDELIGRFDRTETRARESCLAVAMALHSRLGQASPLAVLGLDLLPRCLPEYGSPPLNSWSGVLGWGL
jgi:hypothetical protein